jgi:hypothetical protein
MVCRPAARGLGNFQGEEPDIEVGVFISPAFLFAGPRKLRHPVQHVPGRSLCYNVDILYFSLEFWLLVSHLSRRLGKADLGDAPAPEEPGGVSSQKDMRDTCLAQDMCKLASCSVQVGVIGWKRLHPANC